MASALSQYSSLDNPRKPMFPSILIPGTDEELVYIPPHQSPKNSPILTNPVQQLQQALNQASGYPNLQMPFSSSLPYQMAPGQQNGLLQNSFNGPHRRGKRVYIAHRRYPNQQINNSGPRKVRSAILQETQPNPFYVSPSGLLYQVLIPANAYQSGLFPAINMPIITNGHENPTISNEAQIQTQDLPSEQNKPNLKIANFNAIEKILASSKPKRKRVVKVRRRNGQKKRKHNISTEAVTTEQTTVKSE